MSSSVGSVTLSPQELNALTNYPMMQPPEGLKSNFGKNADNRNGAFFVVDSALLGIMLFFFLNRLYTKTLIIRKYTLDDLTIMLAVIGSVVYYVACIWGAQHGRIGYHEWDISIAQASNKNLLIPSWLIAVLMSPTMLFLKLTFFIMYLYIFSPMRWLKICGYIGAIFTTLFYGSTTIVSFYFSTPSPRETWISHQTTAHEHATLRLSVLQPAVGLAIDIAILVLPIIAVTQLQLPTKRKIGVILIFMTGILACLCSLLSIYYRNILNNNRDITWNLMPVNTVTLLEMFVGIICACTPSAAKTCHHHVPALKHIKSRLNYYFEPLGSKIRHVSGSWKYQKSVSGNNSDPYSNSGAAHGSSECSPTSAICAHKNGIRTSIRKGTDTNLHNDGIHLTHEMHTTFTDKSSLSGSY